VKSKEKKDRKFADRLLNKYRLVILNEETFEERFAIKLTRLNVFILFSLSAIGLIFLTTLLIAFTPLREYIPGYSSAALKKKATTLTYKTDSIQNELELNERYLASIRSVLTGQIQADDINRDSIVELAARDTELIEPSKADSILREKVRKEDKYNLFNTDIRTSRLVLFPPVKGTISDKYRPEDRHFATDIAVTINTPVKAVADGTVIFSEWTVETGYVMIIAHEQQLLSVYKHNASLTKNQGDLVKSGEVIALSGNSGEYTTGPHLHFELWSNGYPVDPENFIDFQ
jgi:murein DD-endopeptidase MepM/ murein hydrolase activator NlpD